MTGSDTKPLSNTARAVQQLREMVFSGELEAGSLHLEADLAARLGMSRTPVREAARTLESQGLLQVRPRKGMLILPISPDDMREIYDVLTELESLAARRAAERGLSVDDLDGLAQAIADMESAVAHNTLVEWARADERFHAELVRLGGNSRIMSIVAVMSDQVRRARNATLYIRPPPTQSNEDHRLVFDAIRDGDADRAAAVHRAHRRAAKNLIVGLLEEHEFDKL